MKHLFILGTAIVLVAGCMASANTWKSSCNSDYSNPNTGTYIFHVKKGEVGGCPSDKLKQEYGGYGWDWSERAEVKTKSNDMFGKWEWSAIIDIERDCRPAYRNTLFQVHAGGHLVNPPSWFGINSYNKFKTNAEGGGNTRQFVPKSPFKLTAKIDATRKDVKIDYFVNEQLVTSTHKYSIGNGYDSLFFKFGSYRVNANGDITQIYTNVKLKKVK